MSTLDLDLNGCPARLTVGDAHELDRLTGMPGWSVLMDLLHGIEQGTRDTLEDSATELDMVRALQGRLSVVKDLRGLLVKTVPEWLNAMRKDS